MRMLNGSLPGSEVDRYTGFPYRHLLSSTPYVAPAIA